MLTTAALLGGSFAVMYAGTTVIPTNQNKPSIEDSDSETEAVTKIETEPEPIPEAVPEPVETPPVRKPEPVLEAVPEPTVETLPEPVPEAVAEPVPEAVAEPVQQGGSQDGGFGRPNWAPVNTGFSVASLGLPAGSTAVNLIAKVSGTYKKSPQEIQSELKNIDDQLRVLKTKNFLDAKKLTNTISEFTQKRQEYLTSSMNKIKYEKYSKFYDDEINKLLNPKNSTESYVDILKREKPQPEDKSGDWLKEWKKEVFDYAKSLPKNDPEGIKPNNNEDQDKWYNRIKDRKVQSVAQPTNIQSKLDELLNKKSENTIALETAKDDEDLKKPDYDEKLQDLKDIRAQISDTNNKIKDLQQNRDLLLVDLSNYESPKKFWDITKKPVKNNLPSGDDLNKLLAEYRDIQTQIKENKEAINDYVGDKLSDPTWTSDTHYEELDSKRKNLETLKNKKINEIEGRTETQMLKVRSLSELDTFIKSLKENKVRAVSLFDNSDFKKVFDTITLISLDKDPKNLIVNLDKYYNFFNAKKGLGYNGEIVDKVFFYLNNFEMNISDPKIIKLIVSFYYGQLQQKIKDSTENIDNAIEFMSLKSSKKNEEFEKLTDTQKRILEGRSNEWHSYIADIDNFKPITKTFSDLLFKKDLDKLTALKTTFERQIVNKVKKNKYESTVPSSEPVPEPAQPEELQGPTGASELLSAEIPGPTGPDGTETEEQQGPTGSSQPEQPVVPVEEAPVPASESTPSPNVGLSEKLKVSDYVKLKPNPTKKTGCLSALTVPSRQRIGKIVEINGITAKINCFNGNVVAKGSDFGRTYLLSDLVKVDKPEGFPTGGYTRKHFLRSIPSRRKTRRTY